MRPRSGGPPKPPTVVIDPSAGVPGAPPGSCAAEPTRRDCPSVSKIVLTGDLAATAADCTSDCPDDPDQTGYGPDTKAGDICGVTSSKPFLTYNPRHAHGRAENYCQYGYGVEYTELHESLHKLNQYGYWDFKSRNSTVEGGAGSTVVSTSWDCGSTNQKYWRATALAYTVINGVGYGGSNRKYTFLWCGG
jgi:hypothetical protein